jgi:hypothetical protein
MGLLGTAQEVTALPIRDKMPPEAAKGQQDRPKLESQRRRNPWIAIFTTD